MLSIHYKPYSWGRRWVMNEEFLNKVIDWMYQDTRGEWNTGNGDKGYRNKVNGFQVTQHIRQYIQGIERKSSVTTWVKFPFITEPLIPERYGGKSRKGLRGRDLTYLFDMAFKEYCYNNYALQQEEFDYVFLHYLKKLHRLHCIDIIRLEDQILFVNFGESYETYIRYR